MSGRQDLTNVISTYPHWLEWLINGRNINASNRFILDIVDIEKQEGAIIFLDQTKALGRVEWEWVKLSLDKFGFKPKFCKWIKMLLF